MPLSCTASLDRLSSDLCDPVSGELGARQADVEHGIGQENQFVDPFLFEPFQPQFALVLHQFDRYRPTVVEVP